jgi:multidrug resistance efflux pump
VLFQIDDRIYKQRVHQAEAQLAMKEAALKNNLQQRKSAEATIAKNEAALQNARAQNLKIQADLKRVQELTADGSLSIRERDSARASAAQGTADIEQAKAALEMSRQDLNRPSSIAIRWRPTWPAPKPRWSWRRSTCKTPDHRPHGGQLGQISVRLGAYVTAGTHLTSLVPPQHWVIANLKETQLAEVRIGQPVTFTVDALNGEKFTARCRASPRRPAWSSAPFRRTTPPATLSKSPSAFRCASRLTRGRKTASACGRACRCR